MAKNQQKLNEELMEVLTHGVRVHFPSKWDSAYGRFPFTKKYKYDTKKVLERVKKLIAKGADVNYQTLSHNMETPLMKAVRHCPKDENFDAIFYQLVNNGANVNAQNFLGDTALMLAWDSKVLRLLKNNGADLEIEDDKGNTALMKFCINEHDVNARTLLQMGANPNHVNRNNETALCLVVENKNREIYSSKRFNNENILKNDLKRIFNDVNSSFSRNEPIFLELITHHADPNLGKITVGQESKKYSVLEYEVLSGASRLDVDRLIKNGAEFDLQKFDEETSFRMVPSVKKYLEEVTELKSLNSQIDELKDKKKEKQNDKKLEN